MRVLLFYLLTVFFLSGEAQTGYQDWFASEFSDGQASLKILDSAGYKSSVINGEFHSYTDELYLIRVTGISCEMEKESDFIMRAGVRCVSGDWQSFGIGAAIENFNNGFFFEITMDGTFKVFMMDHGMRRVLTASTASSIRNHAYNDLMIIKAGNWLYCYINFTLHGTYPFEPKGGAFVLMQHGQQHVICDYMYIREKRETPLFFAAEHREQKDQLKLNGNVVEAGTGRPLVARVKYKVAGDSNWHFVPTQQDGSFSVSLPEQSEVHFAAQKKGFYGPQQVLKKGIKKNVPLILELDRLAKGVTLQLNNIYFEFSKPVLVNRSQPELERLKALLISHPRMNIEIGGHTSLNSSPESYNLQLSLQRANAVKEYLVREGIDPARLVVKGYGNSKPIERRSGQAYQERNRRVEFTILGM